MSASEWEIRQLDRKFGQAEERRAARLPNRHALSYLAHLDRVYGGGKPVHVVMAYKVLLPALEHAARIGITRFQELEEERFR